MSTIEHEVSEGIPTEGRIFQPPERNRDHEKPRYLSFIGSLVDPDIVRSRPWTKDGGVEIVNPCLRYVKNFLRKGRITPLLRDTHDFLPYDFVKKTTEIDPLGAGYFAQQIPQGYVPPSLPPAQGTMQGGFGAVLVGGPSPYGNLVGRLALPGEQIRAVTEGEANVTQTNIRRGVVEHKSLAGHEYRPMTIDGAYVDPDIWQMQRAIFPTYPILPLLLDDLERLLDAAEVHTMLRAIIDDDRESLDQFRSYADATIQNVHHTMRESASRNGYVFRYTSMDLVLLEQLGMARQDREIRSAATAAPNTKLEGMFEQWLAIQIEEKKANLERMERVAEPIIDETPEFQVTAAPEYDGFPGASGYSGYSGEVIAAEHTVVAESAKYACECGKEFPTPQGRALHKTRHCELNKKAEKTEG